MGAPGGSSAGRITRAVKQTSARRENVSGEYIVQQTVRNARAPGPKYKPNKNGYFGRAGSSSDRRILPGGIQEAEKFFKAQTNGYSKESIFNYKDGTKKGVRRDMPDGTVITYRPISSSDGSPAVFINRAKVKEQGNVKTQKIHFLEE